jgi:hypothetical protein
LNEHLPAKASRLSRVWGMSSFSIELGGCRVDVRFYFGSASHPV